MKKLIVCCDGTWNRADQEHDGIPCPSNVIKIAFRIAKRDGSTDQVLFYDQGVGTGNLIDRFSGGAFGEGLVDNIFDAYRFLIANYEPGDELFVFGFSRGAYTARSLCGMIRKCGILKRSAVMHYSEALRRYRDESRPDDADPIAFRTKNSVVGNDPIPITFLGVWDTVGALGIPLQGLRWLTRRDHQFHDTQLSGSVKRAYHALAIDERRASFEPTLWDYVPKDGQVVKQVWFAGAHSDVGGGYTVGSLSDISLGWMIEGAKEAGLAFDPQVLVTHPLKPNPLTDIHNSKSGLFALLPGNDRDIGIQKLAGGQLDPTQSVHPSVMVRWDKLPEYRPKNLVEYFRRNPRPNPVPTTLIHVDRAQPTATKPQSQDAFDRVGPAQIS